MVGGSKIASRFLAFPTGSGVVITTRGFESPLLPSFKPETMLQDSKIAKIMRDTMAQVTNMVKSLNYNKGAILHHQKTLQTVMKKLESYHTQYKDKEFVKTLSQPEYTALCQNAHNYSQTMQEVQKEIDYLDMGKHSQYIHNVINNLEVVYVTLNHIFEDILLDSGEIAMNKLAVINPNKFTKFDYEIQVNNLESELDVFVNDLSINIKEDLPKLIEHEYLQVYHHAMLAWRWMILEMARIKGKKPPRITDIKLPEEVMPEIPDSPESETNPVKSEA